MRIEADVHVHVHLDQRDDGKYGAILNRLTEMQQLITSQGERIMTQEQDLQAALADISGKVDAVSTSVGSISTGMATVSQEVNDLIARLQQSPAAVDLADEIAAAQAIATKLQGVADQAKAAQDTLAAIPPAPSS